MTDENSKLSSLHRQRGSLKRKVNDFKTFISDLKNNICNVQDTRSAVKNLQTRIERLVPIADQMQDIHNKICELSIINEVEENDYVSEFDESYYAVLSDAHVLLDEYEPAQINVDSEINSSASSIIADTKRNIKLPQISLPKFTGQYVRWLEFHDTFSSMINANQSLDDIEKFHYLKASLEGDAADVIKSLQISAANYTLAWNLLCERYTNKKLLVQNHIRELFNLKEVSKESAPQLRDLSDTVTKHLRSLSALGQPTDSWDPIIIYLISSKFDKITARDWETFNTAGELPTLNELKTFLRSKADMLENLSLCHNDTKQVNKDHKIYSNNRVQKSFVTSSLSCYYCKKSHPIYHCDKFKGLSITDRIKQVQTLKLCTNCLRNSHLVQNCESQLRGCKKCGQPHNTLLHVESQKNTIPENPQVTCSNITSTCGQVLLATTLLELVDRNGKSHICRALLDSASQSNFITNECQQRLNLESKTINIAIQGINQVIKSVHSQCTIQIKSCVNTFRTELKCLIIDKITDNLPNSLIKHNSLPIPEDVQLADPLFYEPNKVDLLIGAQIFWSLLKPGQINLGRNCPILQNTKFGWILSGPIKPMFSNSLFCCFNKTLDIQEQLQQFWELEECPNSRSLSKEEQLCESQFLDNVKRDTTGRYVVSIPFKGSTNQLGNSRLSALKRLYALEKRFKNNSKFRDSYNKFMNDYESLHHMSKVNNVNDNESHFYLPHHGVINEYSQTTKLRVVFDGSCPSSTGLSINDLQLVGPTLQSNLFSILVRFRRYEIAFAADIQKMYRQISIDKGDRKFQRIVWRSDSSLPVETYELNTVTYGTASAPYLATRCLMHLANETVTKDPKIAEIIKSDFYVDDVLSGADTSEEAGKICIKLNNILEEAHFKLHKWISNDPTIFHNLHQFNEPPQTVCIGTDNIMKTLGLFWTPSLDSLGYKISLPNTLDKLSKRHILSSISKIFDPLGLLSASTILGKIMLQSLWKIKSGWDDQLPREISDKWIRFQRELTVLNTIKIPRYIFSKKNLHIELHGFSDASEVAYGACIYAKTIDQYGKMNVTLICAKTKVAPLRQITIPRLELCGAHLLSKLIMVTKNALRVNISKVYLWCDSTIVLGWIKIAPSSLKIFVSHRVADIQEYTKNATWLHVPSDDNPADMASRGVHPEQLMSSNVWWHGPSWLACSDSHWPNQETCYGKILPELKRIESSFVSTVNINLIDFNRFSNFNRLVRTIAYCLNFKQVCLNHKVKGNIGPTVVDFERALLCLLKIIQKQAFSTEINCLKNNTPLPNNSKILALNPFVDDSSILRVGGRLQNSNLIFNHKHQILLPKHYVTALLFVYEHKRLSHAGPQQLLSSLRDKYWPLNGKNYARLTVHQCVICFRCNPKNTQPLMGNLPKDRVVPAMPFQIVGIDYAGPFNIKDRQGRGCKVTKCYIALFICLSIKAVHIELVSNLGTEAFLASFRRFISRRGKPSKIFSDNGTNFMGANNELKAIVNQLTIDNKEITDALSVEGISWEFIPPNSPHFGGLWEAGIKSLKFHIKRVAGNALLTFEQFYTLITQVESVLNSRPLTQLSSDPNDLEPITPSHFLIGRKLTALPDNNLLQLQSNRLSEFERVQQLFQHFWSRWQREYLHTLQERKKWKQRANNLEIGTMVLLKIDNVPSLSWPVGRITEVFPGSDETVRVVNVKTARGTYKRTVTKLFPLPIEKFPDNNCE